MTIPELDDDEVLPPGIHVATIEEVRERFGQFQHSSRRPDLFEKLEEFLTEARATGFVESVIINGSFVTGIEEPNDIDLILALRVSHDFEAVLRPFEYNVISKRRVQNSFNLIFSSPDSARSRTMNT